MLVTNVGGLPDFMKLKIVEPLNTLFKDTLNINPTIITIAIAYESLREEIASRHCAGSVQGINWKTVGDSQVFGARIFERYLDY